MQMTNYRAAVLDNNLRIIRREVLLKRDSIKEGLRALHYILDNQKWFFANPIAPKNNILKNKKK